jgi:hypothetical protein
MPILEGNTGSANTLPGPVKFITCQAGQVVIVDKTTEPATTTTLNPDDVYDAEGKAGLTILDIDGSRIFYESTLENRTSGQMVDTPGSAEQLGTEEVRGDNDPADDKATGSYESRSKVDLYELAKERNLDVHSGDSKAELITALRGE